MKNLKHCLPFCFFFYLPHSRSSGSIENNPPIPRFQSTPVPVTPPNSLHAEDIDNYDDERSRIINFVCRFPMAYI